MLSAEWLVNSELFAGLDARHVGPILDLCREVSYPAEVAVFEEGGEARAAYLLEDGEVALRVKRRGLVDDTRVSGAEKPGAVFGWSALVTPRRYTASAVTTRPSRVIAIDGDALLGALQDNPAVGFQVMHNLAGIISGRLRNAYQPLTMLGEPGLISQG